ncbi:MAG TPA: hypothetical protein VFX37_05495 [Pseudolabrys sp.]|nr:hypothetical protein [Pseudolabrys sp.]
MNARLFLYSVELAAPPDSRNASCEIEAFHRDRGIQSVRASNIRHDDCEFLRWCFADREIAEEFTATFGGLLLDTEQRNCRSAEGFAGV